MNVETIDIADEGQLLEYLRSQWHALMTSWGTDDPKHVRVSNALCHHGYLRVMQVIKITTNTGYEKSMNLYEMTDKGKGVIVLQKI